MRLAALVLVAVCGTAAAQPSVDIRSRRQAKVAPFDQGEKNLDVGFGSQTAGGDHHWAAGGGLGVYLVDGLEASLHATYYWGDRPSIVRMSTELRYVAKPLLRYSPIVPYVGASASQFLVDDPELNTKAVGAHGGIVYVHNFVLGLGADVERFIGNCPRNCWWAYPELMISLPF